MTNSSPPTRNQLLSSPENGLLSRFLVESRNNELSHQSALAAAQAEHKRVREAAIRVYELHELREEHQRIIDLERKEQERLRAEAALVEEERRLRELKAKTVPKLPPEPVPEPPKKVEPAPVQQPEPAKQAEPAKAPEPKPQNPFETKQQPTSNAADSAPKLENRAPTAQAAPAIQTAIARSPAPPTASAQKNALADRYLEIHKELKKLRQVLQAEAKVPGSPLKGKMGTYRREIRVSIGQLTAGKGANAQPIAKITMALKEALDGKVPSAPIEVSRFVVGQRQPAEGAAHNDATLPSLFIYLLNICAKGIINQFINECSANPKAADPIGVFTAHIFSQKDFLWRGESLIDILMAKFRVVCPVLFGLRGSDRTERGRLAIGWKKDGPGYVTEQTHNDRMTGLGAGFASISLRDFSKTSKANPYPPTNYWKALAGIVNSSPNETSNTQYVVLRAMIEGHEQRFLNFYGNAAIAALRLALLEFPKKAPANAAAAHSLVAMVELLRNEGLVLT
ncbi:GLE1-domain-containing protein [Trichoderma citrinoviride]|uniref:mRNA export factor GLE1 n=1 Tax=Trichoderma citrinoviride TaxID=58853 RepID=A0A2T4BJJ8_9HYPO|nr:GLE1-domain-containing protein [Trichoderma citrinoviride]PTB69494.1 GLE1-domain-containing protein [Trichoderma citrinoviride]